MDFNKIRHLGQTIEDLRKIVRNPQLIYEKYAEQLTVLAYLKIFFVNQHFAELLLKWVKFDLHNGPYSIDLTDFRSNYNIAGLEEEVRILRNFLSKFPDTRELSIMIPQVSKTIITTIDTFSSLTKLTIEIDRPSSIKHLKLAHLFDLTLASRDGAHVVSGLVALEELPQLSVLTLANLRYSEEILRTLGKISLQRLNLIYMAFPQSFNRKIYLKYFNQIKSETLALVMGVEDSYTNVNKLFRDNVYLREFRLKIEIDRWDRIQALDTALLLAVNRPNCKVFIQFRIIENWVREYNWHREMTREEFREFVFKVLYGKGNLNNVRYDYLR